MGGSRYSFVAVLILTAGCGSEAARSSSGASSASATVVSSQGEGFGPSLRQALTPGPVVTALPLGGGTRSVTFHDQMGVEVGIRQTNCATASATAPPLTVTDDTGKVVRWTQEYGDPGDPAAPVPVPAGGFSGYTVVPADGVLTATTTTACPATLTVKAMVCASLGVPYGHYCADPSRRGG